jgi:hypothetical protein
MASVYKPFLQRLNAALNKDMAALSSIARRHLGNLSVKESRNPKNVQVAVNAALEEYQDKRPNSPLGKYIDTGASDFMTGYRGTKLLLNKKSMIKYFSSRFKSKAIKSAVVKAIIDASKPLKAGGTRDVYVDLSALGSKYAKQLQVALKAELGIQSTRLPVSVSYTNTYRTQDKRGVKTGVPSLMLAYKGARIAEGVTKKG